jgi:chemotaxis protein methyltransferase CheR
MDTLTVNVTNFFRNSETYEVVEKEVLPTIIKSKSTGLRNIRIWSAGCSIGVEAYSIAILLHKILGNNFSRYNIQITGTDIDKDIIKRAEDAMYSEVEMKEVPADIRTKYFDYDGESYHLKAEIKKVAKIRRNDLYFRRKAHRFLRHILSYVTIYYEKNLQESYTWILQWS